MNTCLPVSAMGRTHANEEHKRGLALNYWNYLKMFADTEWKQTASDIWEWNKNHWYKDLSNACYQPFMSSWDLTTSNLRALRKRRRRESGLSPKRSTTSLARSSPSAALSFIMARRSFSDDARLSSVSFSSSFACRANRQKQDDIRHIRQMWWKKCSDVLHLVILLILHCEITAFKPCTGKSIWVSSAKCSLFVCYFYICCFLD